MGGSSSNQPGAPTNPYSYEQPAPYNMLGGFDGLQNYATQEQGINQNNQNWSLWNLQNPQYANWSGMIPQQQQPPTGTGVTPQQGALAGLPGLTNTASPNVSGASTFSNLLTQSGQAGPPMTPFANAVVNVLGNPAQAGAGPGGQLPNGLFSL